RDGARCAVRARRRRRRLRRRLPSRRECRRLPALCDLDGCGSPLALVDAAPALHAERLQRMVDRRGDCVGAGPRIRTRLAQLRAVRCSARARGRAEPPAGDAAQSAAHAEGPVPARQPADVQPEVLPALGAPFRRLRASTRPAESRPGRAGRRGVPAVPERAPVSVAGGLALALASAIALNWGWVEQHAAASGLPPLSLRAPIRSLRSLFMDLAWFKGFAVGIAGWAAYVGALAFAPLSLVQGVSAGGLGVLALLARRRGGAVTRAHWLAVAVSVGGLAALGLSLTGGASAGSHPPATGLAAWVLASAVVAA